MHPFITGILKIFQCYLAMGGKEEALNHPNRTLGIRKNSAESIKCKLERDQASSMMAGKEKSNINTRSQAMRGFSMPLIV